MIKVEKDSYGRNVILLPPSQDIAMIRYSEGEMSKSNDYDCQFFLLVELFDEVGGVALSGELIDYIINLVKEKEKSDEKCTEYRKLYFDLLTKTTALRMEKMIREGQGEK